MFHDSVDMCAVEAGAFLDTHLGWSGPSRVNNKLASYQYTQLATMDIIADYMEHVKFRHGEHSRPPPRFNRPSRSLRRAELTRPSQRLAQ
jgi:hypothetical protein